MAIWSIVPVSALEYSRIDADFYHPMYLNALESWHQLEERVSVSKLGKLIARPVRTGRTPKSRSIKGDEECVHFIKTATVREGSIDFSNSALLPARVVGERDNIPDDAVVITIIGATPEIVGRVAIVRANNPKCVTNQNVAVVSTKGVCDPYFLTAYFQTKWGRDQIWRHSRQTEQVNLNCREVERVLVPNLATASQEAIGAFVRDAFAAADRSVLLYQEAQTILLSELGLTNWQPKHRLTFVRNYSNTQEVGRIDAGYYQPKYDQIVGVIKNCSCGWDTLGNLCSVKKSVEVGSEEYLEEGIPFVRVSNLSPFGITEEKYISETLYQELTPKEDGTPFEESKNYQPNKGEILLSKDGTPGVAYYLKEQPKKMIPSGGILRLKNKTDIVNNEYLTLVLNSITTREQANRDAGGSIILHWRPDQVEEIAVPILSDKKQVQIQQKIIESFNLRKQSKHLLKCAKRAVQMAIEQDEQTALVWLEREAQAT